MSMNEKTDLDFGALAGPLRTVSRPEKPKEGQGAPIDPWPSRSPAAAPVPTPQPAARPKVSLEAQVSIRGPHEIIERFKRLCKDDRRSYYDMLEIMMDKFETR